MGQFYIEGFSDVLVNGNEIIILKNVGDEITFGYMLEQNINRLNGDRTLTINDDTNNTDNAFQIPRQDFGKGALIVKTTDYQGYSADPVVYKSFLEGCSVNAHTTIDMYEEGDYQIALDYEIKDGRTAFGQTSFFGRSILPTYTDYRYSISFKIRNSNCMVYPMDVTSGSELFDGDITSDGFVLDLARSRYLNVRIKHSIIINGRPVIRGNNTYPADSTFVDSGIYEITVTNQYTTGSNPADGTTITIFVGDDEETLAFYRLYSGMQDEINAVESTEESSSNIDSAVNWLDNVKMKDRSLREYVENNVYQDLVTEFNGEYVVETVTSVYLSQEYLSELEFNSQSNRFFGHTLAELDSQFEGQRYVFTVDPETNETIVVPAEIYGTIDIYDQMLGNVVTGAGVILVCITVPSVTATSAPALGFILACSAENASVVALSTATISGLVSAAVRAYEGGDISLALDAGMISASEGFKIGAITGAITGAAEGYSYLRHLMSVLPENSTITLNQLAMIQRESQMPLAILENLNSYEEYLIYRNAGDVATTINGRVALVRDIDWLQIDINGQTNVERVMHGVSPIDSDGVAYELHHIGQQSNSPLAILSQTEHRSSASYSILHPFGDSDVNHGRIWGATRTQFWQDLLKLQRPDLYAALS